MAGYPSAMKGLRATPGPTAYNDPWLARRNSEIISGLDEFVPDADSAETMGTQAAMAKQGIGVSRDAIREDAMGKVRNLLGLGAVKHQQGMERDAVAPRVAGEFNLRERLLANQGGMDIERERNRAAAERDERYYGFLDDSDIDPTRISRGGVSVSTGRQTQNTEPPTQGQTKALSDARSSHGRMLNRFGRSFLGMDGGRQGYENALNDVLVRSGEYDTISQVAKAAAGQGMGSAEALAELESEGIALSPYAKEYLQLVLGN